MNKPLILISSDSNACSPNLPGAARELRSPAAYSRAVALAGGVPVIGGEQCAAELAEICDALLLSGGPDIEPELFGETTLNASVKCDEPRTKYEYALLDEFLKQGKPIFGICRGSQVMNVYFGGTMYQDLVEQKNWNHMVPHMRHPVTAEEGSILHKLFGKEFNVNSTHHQALKDVAADSLLCDVGNKLLGHLEVDVGFQQSHTHLAHSLLDVALGEPAAAAELFEYTV